MIIKESDSHKTAFSSHHGLYQFTRMPFGFRNSLASFQRAIDIILSSVHFKSVIVHLDDVIVFKAGSTNTSTTWKQYSRSCKTPAWKELFLAPKTIDAVQKMSPQTKIQLRSFLGLCNVYLLFVKHFASIAALLNDRLKKSEND